MDIFHAADVSPYWVKQFQTVKQTAVEYFPDLATVVVSLYQKDKSSSSKQRKYGKVANQILI